MRSVMTAGLKCVYDCYVCKLADVYTWRSYILSSRPEMGMHTCTFYMTAGNNPLDIWSGGLLIFTGPHEFYWQMSVGPVLLAMTAPIQEGGKQDLWF